MGPGEMFIFGRYGCWEVTESLRNGVLGVMLVA
jgi:hypothetical protein